MTLKDATGEDRGYTLIAIPTCLVEPLLDPMRDKPADGAEEALQAPLPAGRSRAPCCHLDRCRPYRGNTCS